MFSSFKKLFGLRGDVAAELPAQPRYGAPATSSHGNGANGNYANGSNGSNGHTARPAASQRQVIPPANAPTNLSIPLKSVLDRLPPELNQRIRQLQVGDAHISVAMQKILSQISQGFVKISFGELRLASPPGTFGSEIDRDRTLIEIPLQEILARLDHSLLSRRPSQRQVVVPPEVTGPFGGQTKVTFSTNPLKSGEPAVPIAAPQPAPKFQAPAAPVATPAPRITPVAPAPVAAPRAPISPIAPMAPAAAVPMTPRAPAQGPTRTFTTSPVAFAQPAAPIIARVRHAAPASPAVAPAAVPENPVAVLQPQVEPAFFRKATPAPVVPEPTVYSPIALEPDPVPEEPSIIPMPDIPRASALAATITPIAPEIEPEPQPIRFQMPSEPEPEPVIVPEPPAAPAETRFLHVSLIELSSAFPEAVQSEIAAQKLFAADVALPFGMVEIAMKQGRVSLPWRIVRSWITPAVPSYNSANDPVMLELPIKVITPLFLAELRGLRTQKKVAIDHSIPDLFSTRAQAEASPAPFSPTIAPAPAAPISRGASHAPAALVAPVQRKTAKTAAPLKAADTNYFSKLTSEEQPEEPAPIVKKGPTPGTAFLVRYATPSEIIAKAAALPGVDGALIALPDGLLVASQIPPTMNADTIAAFLPQIFGRVTQCTKELRLGDLNNLNFTVGTTPWKIFKVGAIYFAAFGRAGEPLPSAQLASIAADLDRKAK